MMKLKQRINHWRKKTRLVTKVIIVNVIFLGVFSFWLFTDFTYTEWGSTKVTNSNLIESLYYKTSDIWWKVFLGAIDNENSKEVNKTLLRIYSRLTGVSQWYDPIYSYKSKALRRLMDGYKEDGNWPALREVAQEQVNMQPGNAENHYWIGYSYEQEGRFDDAVNAYFEALKVDATHFDTLQNLIPLLFQNGDYYRAREVLQPYINTSRYYNNSVCFFWGDDGFESSRKICEKIDGTNFANIVIHISGERMVGAEKLIYARIDPPEGVFDVKYLNIRKKNGENVYNNDFTAWKRSGDMVRLGPNSFQTRGTDPYFHAVIKAPEKISDIDYVELKLSYIQSSVEKDFGRFLEIIDAKEL